MDYEEALQRRTVNQLEDTRKKAEVTLKDGRTVIGRGDCITWLGSEEDEDIDEEFLKFDLSDGDTIFFREKDVVSFRYLE
jgi:hypothetical protein